MFATLVGALPEPVGPGTAGSLGRKLAAQAEAGLELLSWSEPMLASGDVAAGWQLARSQAAALGGASVKAAIVGPYTASGGQPSAADVARVRDTVRALVDAGCPVVEVHEPAAVGIGLDEARRRAFRRAHERLIAAAPGGHLCLAITGGNADAAGAETILVPGYRSYLFDLIAGPDNWRLATRVPPEAGVIVGALDARPGAREVADVLVWAAHYAASTGGRGLDRVGLATAGTLASLGWDEALERIGLLGRAARIAALRGEELGRALDPRSVDIRSAALGRYGPGPVRDGRRILVRREPGAPGRSDEPGAP